MIKLYKFAKQKGAFFIVTIDSFHIEISN